MILLFYDRSSSSQKAGVAYAVKMQVDNMSSIIHNRILKTTGVLSFQTLITDGQI